MNDLTTQASNWIRNLGVSFKPPSPAHPANHWVMSVLIPKYFSHLPPRFSQSLSCLLKPVSSLTWSSLQPELLPSDSSLHTVKCSHNGRLTVFFLADIYSSFMVKLNYHFLWEAFLDSWSVTCPFPVFFKYLPRVRCLYHPPYSSALFVYLSLDRTLHSSGSGPGLLSF